MRKFLVALAASMTLGLAATGIVLAPPIPRIPVFRPPPVRPPVSLPRSVPSPHIPNPHLPGTFRPGVDPVLLPHIDPWRPQLSRQASVVDEINVLARINPEKALEVLARERLLLTVEQRLAAETKVANGLVERATNQVRNARDPWEGLNAVKRTMAQAKTLARADRPVLGAVDAVPPPSRLEARLEALFKEAVQHCVQHLLEEAIGLALQEKWKDAGEAAEKRLGDLPADGSGVECVRDFRQLQRHMEVVELLQASKPLAVGMEAGLPREVARLEKGLRSADALHNTLTQPLKKPPAAEIIEQNIRVLAQSARDVELGYRLGREIAVHSYVQGHPVEALRLLKATKPGNVVASDADACAHLLREMQQVVLAEGTVAKPPAQDTLAPLAAELVRLSKGFKTDLDAFAVKEAQLVKHARVNLLAQAHAHLKPRNPPAVGAAPKKDDGHEPLSDEELLRFLEDRLGPLNDAQRQRALELKRQGRSLLQILFALQFRAPDQPNAVKLRP